MTAINPTTWAKFYFTLHEEAEKIRAILAGRSVPDARTGGEGDAADRNGENALPSRAAQTKRVAQ